MWVEKNVFKGKYYDDPKERLRARMITLLIFVPGLAVIFDLLESIYAGDTVIGWVEIGLLVMLGLLFLSFPKFLTPLRVSRIVIMLYMVFLLIALYIPDKNAELTLFWFAALSIGIFFFLGIKEGIVWVLGVMLVLAGILIASLLNIIHPLYSESLIFQLMFGFLAVSYLVYIIESERNKTEEDLRTAVKNSKTLFKEMHHRTKNNMQLMMGLLETQSFKIEDPKCQRMLHAHIDRIKAMSYVHENLYTGNAIDEVDMHKYLGEILDNLQKITQHTILVDIDYMTMDIKHSMSIGLLVNEAVSNAIEHAYSVGNGRIDVSLKSYGERCELSIKDYGLGFNQNRTYHSLGMTLVEDLSRSLPNGQLHIDTENGTHIEIYFDQKER